MDPPETVGYEFGPYRIDTRERLLRRGDELIPLPPKVGATLLALVGSGGRMLEKGDLLKTVWPDTFVEEGALTRNISLLRKTLGDSGDPPAYIETIPRRGYRFVAAVTRVDEMQPGIGDANVQQPDEPPDGQEPADAPYPFTANLKWVALVAALAAL